MGLAIAPTENGNRQRNKIKGEPYMELAKLFVVSINELLTGEKLEIDMYLDQIEESIKNIRYCL